MLVLTRKEDEKICIGNDIVITVVRCGERVRLGIEAPESMLILREELRKKGTPQEAAGEIERLKAAG
ncbi:MAG: carbon storage regulator [Planctomycetaceae bacterium]|jgi:carbon storage regulator|nr:carbon storage regulator [Planctomycetaceae bacterium]